MTARHLSRLLALVTLATATTVPATADPRDLDPDSLRPLDAARWDRATAAHLLRRAGFAGTPAEIDKLEALGLEGAVAWLVDYEQVEWRNAPPAVPDELYYPPDRARFRTLGPEERREVFEERRRQERRGFEETRLWWLERLAESPRPFEEKMTLFWHGHFTSGMREVRNAVFMKDQNDFLRRHALDNFADLVEGISRDRAMLVYLDGNRNEKEHPNENYARELLELFTLGEGNYTERDIREAARAFTGWGYDRFGFVFKRRQHDFGQKTVLGRSGRLGGDDVIDAILKRPACAEFVAESILTTFVRPAPPRKLVRSFAGVIRRNQYELRPSMRALFMSEAFYHPEARGALVKSPVELVISSARLLGQPLNDLRAVERAVASMGQELMQPPNVKGWPGEAAWINTATLFQRYNATGGLIHGDRRARDRDESERQNDEMMFEAGMTMQAAMLEAESRIDGAPQPPFDPLPWIRDHRLTTAGDVVDFFTAHLLAVPLADKKREYLVNFLAGDAGADFDPAASRNLDRLRTTIALICSTPEFQMY